MPLTKNDVVLGYYHVLGRHPENQAVIDEAMAGFSDIWAFTEALLGSQEFRNKNTSSDNNSIYVGYQSNEVELLSKYQVDTEPAEGFVIDFLGSKTDIHFNQHISHLGGQVEGLPIPCNFHAEAIEWIGTLKAVEAATESFAIAEIGAGWGPWMVAGALAAQRRGINNIYMVGVEADSDHFDSMGKHLQNNGFEPAEHSLIHGVVGPTDGFAFFPRIDSQDDWGAAAIFSDQDISKAQDYRGRDFEYDKLKCFSLSTVLKDRKIFDLCHIDIQGSEQELVPGARDLLTEKVRYLVVGTHSRNIEGMLFSAMSECGWVLENEKPCRFERNNEGEPITAGHTRVDGAQVWRNPVIT